MFFLYIYIFFNLWYFTSSYPNIIWLYRFNSYKINLKKHYIFYFRSKSDIEKYREEKEITLVGENIPKPIFKFDESGFPEIIIKELK